MLSKTKDDDLVLNERGVRVKLSEKISKLGLVIKDMPHCINTKLNGLTNILATENELAKYTSYDFLSAIRPTLKQLASWTSRPYVGYLNEAIDMILQGNGECYTLEHFDIELLKVKGRKV